MYSIQRQCCILTNLWFVIKSACNFFFKYWYVFFNPGNKFNCTSITRTQTCFSVPHLCQIKRMPHKKIGLISIQFPGNALLHTRYTSTKKLWKWNDCTQFTFVYKIWSFTPVIGWVSKMFIGYISVLLWAVIGDWTRRWKSNCVSWWFEEHIKLRIKVSWFFFVSLFHLSKIHKRTSSALMQKCTV